MVLRLALLLLVVGLPGLQLRMLLLEVLMLACKVHCFFVQLLVLNLKFLNIARVDRRLEEVGRGSARNWRTTGSLTRSFFPSRSLPDLL
jgi:hypothetical protein